MSVPGTNIGIPFEATLENLHTKTSLDLLIFEFPNISYLKRKNKYSLVSLDQQEMILTGPLGRTV
jgi:hypothetical protein